MTTNDERQMLRQTVAALVAKHAGPAAVRRAMESERGYDTTLWATLCEQVGAAALIVPEEFGGASGELADAAAVLEELGRGLVPTPLFATTVAEAALLAADMPEADTLEQLAAGTLIGAVAFDPGYVVNGDVADVVLAVDDGRVVRWTDVTVEQQAQHLCQRGTAGRLGADIEGAPGPDTDDGQRLARGRDLALVHACFRLCGGPPCRKNGGAGEAEQG